MVERRNVAGEALEAAACTVDRAAAASAKLSAAQARQMASELATMGDLKSLDDTLNIGERYMWLDTLQVLAKTSPTHTGELINAIDFSGNGVRIDPPHAFWLIPIPFEDSMRTANHFDDGILAIFGLPTYPQRAEAFRLWEHQMQGIEPLSVWSYMTPEWSVATFLPAMDQAEQRSDVVRMKNRLTRTALGLAAYKADHGGYPASLDALVPSCLAAVPNDVFSEKPVIYAPTQVGYTLYSVGPNMIDDGGKSQKPGDDIVASIP
jgi:hypothetical protein